MQYRVFSVSIHGDAEAEASLNSFLRSHRVLKVEQALADDGGFWTFAVEYVEGDASKGTVRPARKSLAIDYMQELPQEQFALYSRLRGLRKEIAQAEAVQAYTIFTNAQLAAMVKQNAQTTADLATISGIGEARVSKYGARFLSALSAAVREGEVQEAGPE